MQKRRNNRKADEPIQAQHASNRTTNNARRRVIHIEFSNIALPGGLQWSEAVANSTQTV